MPIPRNLEEANEELQALVLTRGVEEGRNLLNGTSNSLAQELHDMSQSQLELLQRQVTNLADSQNNVEDITTRTKTEYAVLQARYHMLEEQLRECEMRAEERIAEEQRRNRELLARMEREAQLQSENCQMKVRTVEKEAATHREEVQRLRLQCDKQAADLHATEEKLEITNDNYAALQQDLLEVQAREKKLLAEKVATEELMLEMSREVDRLRSERGPAMPTTSPESSSLEDLDLSCQNHNYDKNKPILVDEETFLSLHATESPSDSDEDDRMRQSGPHSGFFIDDCGRGTPDTLKDEDFNILKREGTKDISPSQEQGKLINDLVEINNAKNNLKSSNLRLIADNQKFLRNGTTKMNGIKAEVCDNLNEQVGFP
uniref:Rab11-FIP3/4 domain-containing protein n=1 Tax=Phlebotomus papatasi TaxID=29031 RepID=A0A1B0DF03_PHLPP